MGYDRKPHEKAVPRPLGFSSPRPPSDGGASEAAGGPWAQAKLAAVPAPCASWPAQPGSAFLNPDSHLKVSLQHAGVAWAVTGDHGCKSPSSPPHHPILLCRGPTLPTPCGLLQSPAHPGPGATMLHADSPSLSLCHTHTCTQYTLRHIHTHIYTCMHGLTPTPTSTQTHTHTHTCPNRHQRISDPPTLLVGQVRVLWGPNPTLEHC